MNCIPKEGRCANYCNSTDKFDYECASGLIIAAISFLYKIKFTLLMKAINCLQLDVMKLTCLLATEIIVLTVYYMGYKKSTLFDLQQTYTRFVSEWDLKSYFYFACPQWH